MASEPPLRIQLGKPSPAPAFAPVFPDDAGGDPPLEAVVGPAGPAGPAGAAGPAGPPGPQGPAGSSGTPATQFWGPHSYVRRISDQSVPAGGGAYDIGYPVDFLDNAQVGGDYNYSTERQRMFRTMQPNNLRAPSDRLNVWYPGIYLITFQVAWVSSASGWREISITENTLRSAGSDPDAGKYKFDRQRASVRNWTGSSAIQIRQSVSAVFSIDVTAGFHNLDYVRGYVRSSVGTTIVGDSSLDGWPRLSATWLAPQYDARP